jgi:signal transduction histidine kinase
VTDGPDADAARGTGAVHVVDDDVGMRDSIVDILDLAGIVAEGFETGAAALARSEVELPSLALLDQRLPDMTGVELGTQLRTRDPDVPVILLTGYVSAENAIAAVGLVDEFLVKPVVPDELIRAVRAGVDRGRLRRENRALVGRLRDLNASLEATIVERTRELENARAEALEASRLKSEFLSQMSHELRTPLNAILGFGQLLDLEDELSAEQRESVQFILKAGRHLLDLINEVLDIGRVEAGQLSLSMEPVHVRELIDDTVQLIRPLAQQRAIAIEIDPAGRDHRVVADRQRLRQILLNLAANAVKYNRRSGSVRIACEEVAGQRLRILVSDTGPGLTPEQQGRLFIAFERLGADASGVEGTGVGLVLSQRLAVAMNGELGVTSSPGAGSTFWIELSLVEGAALPQEATTAAPGTAAAPVHPRPQPFVVLYIEDNLANLALMERVLASVPELVLHVAGDGRTGLELAARHRPDLILLDLHLPDQPGDEVLRHLWAEERTRPIPVVVVSADATPGQIRRLHEAGAHAYITKPLDVPQLLDLVTSVRDQRDVRSPA